MSIQTFITAMAGFILVMAWYANTSKRNKILCTFRRVNKTKIVKFVKMSSRYVIFDNGKYDIIPSRITFQWYTGGIIHMLFPQWVATLDYSYSSRFPHDPNNLAITSETPAVRKALNKEEWVESYYKGAKPSSTSSKKIGLLTQYLPWIAIVLVLLVAVFVYNNVANMNTHLSILENNLRAITK